MEYISSRDASINVRASQAIIQGISPDGGLFVPKHFPGMDMGKVVKLAKEGYINLAKYVIAPYLDEFSDDEIENIVRASYVNGFDHEDKAPINALSDNQYVLELWHGPTLAFKDMALQMLPHLMKASKEKVGDMHQTLILVATSGDTGKAALEGFANVDGISIGVFYPHNGVSMAQQLQMSTHQGENVFVGAIRGNFDDTQTAVKRVFGDKEYAKILEQKNVKLSSANSINWGRLLPQIVYYFWAYAKLVIDGKIENGDKINFVVPTGNFGNILAGYYSKQMGLPVGKLICASNANNVLTEFFESGVYDASREFFKTISPSMDILVSSNLERLLFEIADRNDAKVREWMNGLNKNGKYEINMQDLSEKTSIFVGGCCDDDKTKQTIKKVFYENGYLMDTHTAVAKAVQDEYVACSGDDSTTVIVSTASPYKFSKDVLEALGRSVLGDEFEMADRLCEVSSLAVPDAITSLKDLPIRFKEVMETSEIADRMLKFLDK